MTQSGLCENCFKGASLEGTPKGTMEKIGPWDTYVARPPNPVNSNAIVFFTDIFGLKLINNKLIPDMLAENTGVTVYVPDVFSGEAIPPEQLVTPSSAEEVRSQSLFAKVKLNLKFITMVPFMMRHWPSKHMNGAAEFIKALKSEKNVANFGTVGYCYGAQYALKFNANGEAACTVLCHPSIVSMKDIKTVVKPLSFASAEVDQAFSDDLKKQTKEYFKNEKSDVDFEFIEYKGSTHGFAARPDLSVPEVKAGFEGSLNQTASFFKKYLSSD